jgi:UDP-glucose 4-epimerase
MRTLVVGASGFMGRHIASSLRSSGVEVVGVTSTGGEGAISLREGVALVPEFDAIVYAAGVVMPGSPQSYLEALSLEATPLASLLANCRDDRPPRLVLLSTAGAIYGPKPPDATIVESTLPSPRSVYGLSRMMLEQMSAMEHYRGRVRLSVLRLSNVYGPGQRVGGPSSLIRTLLASASTGAPFSLLGGGEQRKDFVFVEDVVRAVSMTVRSSVAESEAPLVLNIASGVLTSVLEAVAVVERVTGRSITIERRPSRAGDVAQGHFDISTAERLIGWGPSVSLEEGVARCWAALSRVEP